jgi:hypothetical protein
VVDNDSALRRCPRGGNLLRSSQQDDIVASQETSTARDFDEMIFFQRQFAHAIRPSHHEAIGMFLQECRDIVRASQALDWFLGVENQAGSVGIDRRHRRSIATRNQPGGIRELRRIQMLADPQRGNPHDQDG